MTAVEPAVVTVGDEQYQMDPEHPLHLLAANRIRKDRDLKVIVTARNGWTGVGKTTLAGYLGLSWNPVFADEAWTADGNATLQVSEYFNAYRRLQPGSVLMMDEAEQLDARRSMSGKNVQFSHEWMMLRTRQVISVLTLPSPDALDKRLETLADVWINVIRRGTARVHGIQVLDYGRHDLQTPHTCELEFPDISDHPEMQRLEDMKNEHIDRIHGGDNADNGEDESDELPEETQKRIAAEYKRLGWSNRKISNEVDEITYSYEKVRQWVNELGVAKGEAETA